MSRQADSQVNDNDKNTKMCQMQGAFFTHLEKNGGGGTQIVSHFTQKMRKNMPLLLKHH